MRESRSALWDAWHFKNPAGVIVLTERVALELCSLDPSRTSVGIMRESRSALWDAWHFKNRIRVGVLDGEWGWVASTLDLWVSISTFDLLVSIRRLTFDTPRRACFYLLSITLLCISEFFDSDLTMRVMMVRGGIKLQSWWPSQRTCHHSFYKQQNRKYLLLLLHLKLLLQENFLQL